MAEIADVDVMKVKCCNCRKVLLSSNMKSSIISCGCDNNTTILLNSIDLDYIILGVDLNKIEFFNPTICKYEKIGAERKLNNLSLTSK